MNTFYFAFMINGSCAGTQQLNLELASTWLDLWTNWLLSHINLRHTSLYSAEFSLCIPHLTVGCRQINVTVFGETESFCFKQGDPVVVLLHELSQYEGDWSVLPALPRWVSKRFNIFQFNEMIPMRGNEGMQLMASCGSFQSLWHLRPIGILVFLHRGGNQSRTVCSAAGPQQISSPRGEISSHNPDYIMYIIQPDLAKWMSWCIFTALMHYLVPLLATGRNGFWVSVSMTTTPPSSTTMPSLRTPLPLVTQTLRQAGLSAHHCSTGVCVCVCVCVCAHVRVWVCHWYGSPISFFFTELI